MAEELEAREAVRQAYQAYYRRLVAALYALTGDYAEAQDLVQEAYARALARPRVFLDVADPEAWLRTVAVNLARTRWRRRRLFDTLVRTGRVTRTPDSVPGADPNRVALVAALQQLSRPTREAIVLHHLADMSVYEVAEALGVPVGTVKARLSRGRTMLATLLNERADEPVEAGEPGATAPAAPVTPAPRSPRSLSERRQPAHDSPRNSSERRQPAHDKSEPGRAARPVRTTAHPYPAQPHYAPEPPRDEEPPREPDLLTWPGRHG